MRNISAFFLILFVFQLSAAEVRDSSRISELMFAINQLDAVEDHCEVPCGIYGDSLRIALIDEHIRTIEKATTQIIDLSAQDKPNFNQLIRWVNNKEKHAEEIQTIVSQYFLHQRVKITDESNTEAFAKYQMLLTRLHHILVYAMKAKQGTDLDNIGKLKAAVESFEEGYFHKH